MWRVLSLEILPIARVADFRPSCYIDCNNMTGHLVGLVAQQRLLACTSDLHVASAQFGNPAYRSRCRFQALLLYRLQQHDRASGGLGGPAKAAGVYFRSACGECSVWKSCLSLALPISGPPAI